jgi:hypothetical protein
MRCNTLHAEEQGRDLKGAIRTAFDEVLRQLDRFKSKLRGEHRWTAGKHEVNLQDVAPFSRLPSQDTPRSASTLRERVTGRGRDAH